MRKRRLIARASVGALAGLAAGLVTGVGARVAMRMVADGVPDGILLRPVGFTLAGSAVIVLTLGVMGASAGILYDAIAARIPGPPRARGLVFGVLLLVVLGPLFFLGNPDEFFTEGRVRLFALLFLLYGVVLGLALAPSRRIANALPHAAQTAVVVAGLVGAGLMAFELVTVALQSTGLGSM